MLKYVPADDAAVLLGKLERDVLEMLHEGDLNERNLRGVVDGYFEMLQVRRADVLLKDVDGGWKPEIDEA